MISRYEVTLNGNKLSAENKNLLILDVSYSGIQYDTQMNNVADLDGYDMGRQYASEQTVTVTFELRIYDIAARNKACQAVATWAKNGGKLEVNDRAGQYLNVRCKFLPVINSAKKWTGPLTIVFSSVGVPYWYDNTEKVLSLIGPGPSKGNLVVVGNAPKTNVSVTVTTQAKITSLKFQIGSTLFINLTGLNIAANKTVYLTYTDDRYLKIVVDKESLIPNMTAASADRLTAVCGKTNTVTFTASGKCTAKFTARGMWM